MRTLFRSAGTACALWAMTAQALAAGYCARPDEMLAIKTAAIQQELMVAALYCNDTGSYNLFVTSHQKELQDSDATLLSYFKRGGGKSGESAYHAYKTALANGDSLASLHAMQSYCAAANAMFDSALSPSAAPTLADFVVTQSVAGTEDFLPCREASSVDQLKIAANRRN